VTREQKRSWTSPSRSDVSYERRFRFFKIPPGGQQTACTFVQPARRCACPDLF
jgi:hypothetical protein